MTNFGSRINIWNQHPKCYNSTATLKVEFPIHVTYISEWCISLWPLWTVDMLIGHVIINTVMAASRYQSRTFIGHSDITTHNTLIAEQSDRHLSACILTRLLKSVPAGFAFNCLVVFAKPRNTAHSRTFFFQNSHSGHLRARPWGRVYAMSFESKFWHMFYVQYATSYSTGMADWRLTGLPNQHVPFKAREFSPQNTHNSYP